MSVPDPQGTRVSLASGDHFFVADADPADVHAVLKGRSLIALGHRYVNPALVAQLTFERIPSIEIPERLEANGVVSN